MNPILNRNIRLLLLGANLWYVGEGMLGPLIGVFSQEIGGSVLDLTWAWSIYLIVTGICTGVIGVIADRGRATAARLMVVGYGLNALCTFAYLLVEVPWQLFLVQAGLGFASALATPTWDALYSRNALPRRAGMLWGAANAQELIVSGIAILIGGYLVTFGSFKMLFLVMGCVQVLATILQAQILIQREAARVQPDS